MSNLNASTGQIGNYPILGTLWRGSGRGNNSATKLSDILLGAAQGDSPKVLEEETA